MALARLDRTRAPVQQTNLFEIGDLVGATLTVVAVPAPLRVQAIWLRMGQDVPIPISDLAPMVLDPGRVGPIHDV